ncbi:acyltransferase [soil metagenome]
MQKAPAKGTVHVLALDGLRAASILPVVWHHSTPRPLEGALGRGPLGVDLFFALSGFLITTLLLRERRRTKKVHLFSFFVRRSLRLFPLYYLTLAIYAVYAQWVLGGSTPPAAHFFKTLPFYATYTGNWFATGAAHPILFAFSWSLATEEQFYVLWAPLLRVLRGHLVPALAMIALVTIDQLAERGFILESGTFAHRIVTSFATPIGFGCLLAIACDHRGIGPFLRRVLGRTEVRVFVFAVSIAAFAFGIPLIAAHATFAVLVGCAAVEDQSPLFGWARNPAVVWVGKISYGIYLLHVTVIALVHRVFPAMHDSAWFVFAIAFPLSIALASGTYLVFEKPLFGLRERFRAGIE